MAIIAFHVPGEAPITSPYAPDFLLAGEVLQLDNDMPQLAIEALDRILGDNSEWRDLWGEGGEQSSLSSTGSGPSCLVHPRCPVSWHRCSCYPDDIATHRCLPLRMRDQPTSGCLPMCGIWARRQGR